MGKNFNYLLSDEVLSVMVPIALYWIYSGFYMMLSSLTKYRLHSVTEEQTKNLVSKSEVVRGVLVQQFLQATISLILIEIFRDENSVSVNASDQEQTSTITIVKQFLIAMFVFDTWQYFWHRYLHMNKFLYKHLHSRHHRLIIPYCFGSQYNHPLEGLLLDTVGATVAILASGMTTKTTMYFSSLTVIKGIDDHCSMWLPGNLFHILLWNNTAYHDVHHQLYGNKYNFSQAFFITWDKIMGTYMPHEIVKRADGSLELRPAKDKPE